MKFISALFLLFIASLVSQAQTFTTKYDWDPKPKTHTITAADASDKVVGLKDKRILEYYYNDAKKTDLVMNFTNHTIVKVNSAEGIEEFNKIYIPVDDVMEIIQLKARSISKDGKVVTLGKDNIKTEENEENGGSYKYFAMEGLAPGSEVEYFYTLKFDASFWGSQKLQGDFLKNDVSFDLYTPGNFIFGTKSYNGLAEATEDTSIKNTKHWTLHADQIPSLRSKQFSAYTANLQRIEYTVEYNEGVSNKRMFDWAAASTHFFNRYFLAEDKERSDVAKFLKKLDVKGDNDKEKMTWLDNYLKTNIALQKIPNPELNDLRKILEKKVANSTGIMRLYIQIAEQMKINSELVLTTNRYNKRFDGSFQSWDYLDMSCIYFPSLDIYLAPEDFVTRNGLPPTEFQDNDGLFIKKVTVGDLTSGVGKVKHITASDWKMSQHNIYADAKLAEPFDEVTVHVRQEISGHAAEFVQAYYDFLNDEQKKKALDPLVQLIGDDGKISNLKFTNDLNENVAGHPFIVESDITISSVIEKAGNRILFKIGNLIGTQVEMYSDDKPQNDVENEFNRGYYRELTFNIPDGYVVKNLDALNLDVEAKDGDNIPYYFRASYTVQGNKVKVVIQETYQQIRYPLAKFEDFRKVVNAAADWNKVVMILEKK